jgi:hypothetical protein
MLTLIKSAKFAALSVCVALLAACGGGGGGGEPAPLPSPTSLPTAVASPKPTVLPTPVVSPAPVVNVQVSGVANYESVPYLAADIAGLADAGSLNFAATTLKPIRGATIQAVSGATVFATAVTSETGSYVLNVPQNTSYNIRVLAELVKTSGTATWNVALNDNTNNNALWSIVGPITTTTTTNTVFNITAGTGWSATANAYTGSRAAGLFAILDTIYSGMTQIAAVQPGVVFPKLDVFWSAKNISTTVENLPLGQFRGKTFFNRKTTNGIITARSMYILGAADNDSDEFDPSVIAHEFGHYLQSVFSKMPSIGGEHTFGDKLDMTLAFGEGWGNAYSSILRNDPIYADSFLASQRFGFTLDVTSTPLNQGWYNENSVANVIYGLYKVQGFASVWNAIKGPMNGVQDSLATVFSFADAVRSTAAAAVNTSLNTLLTAQSIFSGAGADQWGANEINNGGAIFNLPPYKAASLNTPVAANCLTSNIKVAGVNKLGAVSYYRISSMPAGVHTVTATFDNGRDVDVEVFQKGVSIARAATGAVNSEVLPVNLPIAGDVVVRFIDYPVPTTTFNISASTPSCATLTVK